MLRGTTNHAWEVLALGIIALVTFVLAWILLRTRDDPCLTNQSQRTRRRPP